MGFTPPMRNFFHDGTGSITDMSSTAYHLNSHPHLPQMSVDEVAMRFQLPDLRPALADYLSGYTTRRTDRRHQASFSVSLPFDKVAVWFNVKLQLRSFHDNNLVMPAQAVQAAPPSDGWPFGRCDTVLLTTSGTNLSGASEGFQGQFVRPYARQLAYHFLKIMLLPKSAVYFNPSNFIMHPTICMSNTLTLSRHPALLPQLLRQTIGCSRSNTQYAQIVNEWVTLLNFPVYGKLSN